MRLIEEPLNKGIEEQRLLCKRNGMKKILLSWFPLVVFKGI